MLTQSSCRVVLLAAVLVGGSITPHAESRGAVQRTEGQQEYWAQVDRGDWAAAIAAAQQLVDAARENAAQQPLALAETLALLGNAQLPAGDYVSAEAAFAESLQLVEQHGGAATPKLIAPLQGLGTTFAASGRHEEAIPQLDRAVLITRRSYGLFDIRQREMLRELAASLTRLGRTIEAERHMGYFLQMGERVYGKRDPRLVPLLCIVGDWYAEVASFVEARSHYRSALDIVERKLGRNDAAAVAPLRALARSYKRELELSSLGLKETGREKPIVPADADGTSNENKPINPRYLSGEGEKALQRAINILQSQSPPDQDVLLAALVELGDWFQIKHQPEKALPIYRRAAALTAGDEGAERDSHPAPLSFPVRVYYPVPFLATRNVTLSRDQVDEKFVEVQFTVTGRGEVANARVTDQNATSRQVSEALQAIRGARFRPKFVNGEPVDTAGMTSREIFRMRKHADPSDDS